MICTLALVMLLDVSHSVDESRWIQQRNGHVDAFRSETILNHVNTSGPIAVAVAAFSDNAEAIIGWQILENRLQVLDFATRLENIDRPYFGMYTNIYAGITTSINLHSQEIPCTPERRVIDVSADGEHNSSSVEINPRDIAEQNGITINGIAISRDDVTEEVNNRLREFFEENVKTSDGFVLVSNGFNDIARAVRRKLEIEIIGQIENSQFLRVN